MSDNKSVISGEFDRTDRYEAGLKSLANSLRADRKSTTSELQSL